MYTHKKLKIIGVLAVMLCLYLQSTVEAAKVYDLRCEYMANPLGIDAAKPRLSWLIGSDQRGEKQTAYQVLVASSQEGLKSDKGDLWDSGKVASDRQNQLEYQGKPLESQMRCYWKARIWDKDGKPSSWSDPALWSMGLLTPKDWKAEWIDLEDTIPEGAFDYEITEGKLVIKKAIYSGQNKKIDITDILNELPRGLAPR